MSQLHERLSELQEKLRLGQITRRDFLRYATLLGVSVGAAEALAACAPKPGPTAVPPTKVPPTKVPPTAVAPSEPAPTAPPPVAEKQALPGHTLLVDPQRLIPLDEQS